MSEFIFMRTLYCTFVVALYYGSISLLSQFFTSCIPFGLIFVLSILGLIYYYRVPPPNEKDVEAVLGKDLPNVTLPKTEYVVTQVAHRGAGLDVPEHTAEAYKYCKEKGCNFIEFDVSLTADGIPVVFHDKSTERVSNRILEISKTKYKDLKDVNISEKHPHRDRFQPSGIQTLEETVAQLLANGQRMFIDVKNRDGRLVNIILDLYKRHPELYTKAIVTSFFASMIYQIRRRNPRIIGAIAWCPHVFYYAFTESSSNSSWLKKNILHMLDTIYEWLLPRFTYFLIGLSVILLHRYSISIKSIWDWRKKRGVRVMAWTVNNPAEKKYCTEVLKIPYLTDTFDDQDSSQLDKQMTYFES
ncbi:hypothetical protein HHI36_016159 [Cryptolaemus montrouzieri]|uniref:GP-PDE domain-containing protein n=1 Tax=Cryptolaemus montrouzieri TaxID=559131 RepID=A0ABD2NJ31_9CUCU